MARHNTKDKRKKHIGWKFYTILSSIIALAAVAIIVTLVVVYNKSNTATYKNLFTEWTEYKVNYNEIIDEDFIKEDTGRFSIIFVYDEDYMTPEKVNKLKSSDPDKLNYEKCNAALKEFYDAIQLNHEKYGENKEEGVSKNLTYYFEFYVINASLLGNDIILSNESYGKVGNAPSIIVLDDEGNYLSELKDTDKKVEVSLTSGKGNYQDLTKDLKELKSYIANIEE